MQRATRDEKRAYVALRLGSIVLPMLAAVLWGLISFRGEMQATRSHAEENALLVSQYIERMVQTQSVIHSAVRVRAQDEQMAFLRSREFHDYLSGIDAGNTGIFGIAVIQVDGTFVASSRIFPLEGKSGPRDYLDAMAAGDRLFIDRIKLEQSREDAMIVASPLPSIAGRPAMAIVSAMDSRLIMDFLRGIATRTGEAASVMRADGKLLIRNVPSEPVMLPADTAVRRAIASSERGAFVTKAVTDQTERLYAYRKLHDLPLYANFGTPTKVIAEDWMLRALPVWLSLALIGLFTAVSAGRLRQRMAARYQLEATHRKLEAAERLAEERIRLMRETNHRVKNNLSLVVSLINMQMRGKTGIDGNELKARIAAISRVHDLMYQAADGVHVDFSETLREIAASPAIVPREQGISVICEAEAGIVLGPETTTPLAIIAAEMLTNAVKHAFQGRSDGTIRVRLNRKGETGLLEVTDDGVGLPEVAPRRSGAAIIDALVQQIGGEITRETGRAEGMGGFGLRMLVRFPLSAG